MIGDQLDGLTVTLPGKSGQTATIHRRTALPEYTGDRPWNVVDYTTLSSIDRCPTWGLVRYVNHKTFSGTGRAMALEAGSAVHDAINAARLFQLWWNGYPDHAEFHTKRLFDDQRWRDMSEYMTRDRVSVDGEDECRKNTALTALHNSGFIDHPNDRRRTMANIEESVFSLMDFVNWEEERVWVSDPDNPEAAVGIELPFAFDIVLPNATITYVGALDGINEVDGNLILQENKSTWRINEPWRDQFSMTHQVTGYCIGAALYAMREVTDVEIVGVSIPPPKQMGVSGVDIITTERTQSCLPDFLQWVAGQAQQILEFKDQPTDAPKHTTACARFNHSCPLIPLCTLDPEERRETFDEELVDDGWNVLEGAKTLDG